MAIYAIGFLNLIQKVWALYNTSLLMVQINSIAMI